MDGKVAANITVAGKIYPMRIAAEDEEILKKAEAFIRNKMDEYSKYSDIDREDILAVVLLNVTANLLEFQQLNDSRRLTVEKIDRELGIYLEQQGSLENIE
ncbi:MAG: cell division protein ZapA [Prevotellaceae bacterium]|jgi:cell division protein ZapA (FtsZ GTPase activity inhibitor)|nr:cell division protein ZapA [Prevotellaceae bacterium]